VNTSDPQPGFPARGVIILEMAAPFRTAFGGDQILDRPLILLDDSDARMEMN